MFLQWFPGHMTKAIRMMENEVKLCDGIIYTLDARAPYACLNTTLEPFFKGKPVVYLLNKADLSDEVKLKEVVNDFKSKGKRAVVFNAMIEKNAQKLYIEILNALKEVKERYAKKGVNKPLRVMVSGIPNTGKSTVINLLCGTKKAKTGDKAGVTKDKQWIKIKDLELLDTPGTTSPSFDNQKNAMFLALIGSINDDILDFIELSIELINYLESNYNGRISEVYKIDVQGKSAKEIFCQIGKKRGALQKGGEIDEERTASIIINDLRKGKLGKILFV
ncbi:MAG: ribosome biogenesis GTPase YlqF [Clostridia bacterium]|nr:ribosome biogenesis GTPase YlqF [Clostridia bacterium]